jgi:aminomethyltransferase
MDALDLFRIEGGFIIGGVEYDPTVSPYECGLGWAVDLNKPGFQGRDALLGAEQASTLRLTSVELDGGGAEASGAELSVDGAVVGFITQAVVSPYLEGRTLGLAKVDRNRTQPGTAVEARVAGEGVPGSIIRHPAYDPERRRVKG